MKNNICMLFTSRNNYHLLEEIFFKYSPVDFENINIFNIDIDSDENQKKYAAHIFDKYKITNIPVDSTVPGYHAVANNIQQCVDYLSQNNISCDWLLWFSHDCHLIGEDFFNRLDNIIEENKRFKSEVGMIGFCDWNQCEMGKPLYGRGKLPKGIAERGGWYHDLPESYSLSDYFIVDAPNDNGLLVNIDLWKKYIVPTNEFPLFHWGDDICGQFALKGIYSITIPSLEMADLYREKKKYGVSRSLDSNSRFHIENYKKHQPWEANWLKKYGYSCQGYNPMTRKQFESVKENYKGTVQEKIYNLSISEGPKKLEDII